MPGIHPNSLQAARRTRLRDQKASACVALSAPYALGPTLHFLMLGYRTVPDSHRRLVRIPVGGSHSQMTLSRCGPHTVDATRHERVWDGRTAFSRRLPPCPQPVRPVALLRTASARAGAQDAQHMPLG